MLKILLVNNITDYSNRMAAANRTLQIALGFKSNDCTPFLYSITKKNDTIDQIEGVTILSYKSIIGVRKKKIGKALNFVGIKYLIDQFDIDLIFAQNFNFYTLLKLKIISLNTKTKLVYDIVEDPLGKYINRSFRFYSLAYWLESVTKIFDVIFLYSLGWRLPDYLTVISHNLGNLIEKIKIRKPIIYLPILRYIDSTKVTKKSIDNNIDIITYCGSLSLKKDGLTYLFKAIKILKSEGIEIKLQLYGPSLRIDQIRINRYIKKYNIEKNVKFHGFVQDEILKNAMNNSFALVLPKPLNRQNKYNFATKLIDYLESKRPVITTDVGEIEHYFTHRVNAIIVESNQSYQLAEQIKWLRSNSEQATLIGLNGYRTLIKEFNSSTLIQSLLKIVRN